MINNIFISFLLTILLLTFLVDRVNCDKPKATDSLITAVYLEDVGAVKNHLKNIETIKKELDPSCPKNTRCKPVTYAAESGNIKIMQLLLEKGADIEGATGGAGDTPLMLAIMNNKIEMAKYLIKKGADVNKTNKFGANAFWGACAMGKSDLIPLMIKSNAKIEHKGRFPDPLKKINKIIYGITPLMIASALNKEKVVSYLMDAGADLNTKDSEGRTVRDYINYGRNNKE